MQFAAILIPIMIAHAIALGNIYAQTTQQKAAVEAYTDNLYADVVVTAYRRHPRAVTEALVVPGVTAASDSFGARGGSRSRTTARTRATLAAARVNGPVYKGKVKAGSLDDLTGETIALPPGVRAKKLKVDVGSEIGVRLGTTRW